MLEAWNIYSRQILDPHTRTHIHTHADQKQYSQIFDTWGIIIIRVPLDLERNSGD